MWLTGRSIALLAVAGVALVLALTVGIPALLYVVGLCASLVVVAVLAALWARPRLAVSRVVTPVVVEAGGTVAVEIDLRIETSVPVQVMGWKDRTEATLQGTAHGAATHADGHGGRLISYELTATRRGRHRIGPLSVVVGDGFGLTARSLTDESVDHVVVLPARVPLDRDAGPGVTPDGASQVHRSTGLGHDDVIARPYLPGDALKRWHWKATAHRGQPMVRQEETEDRPAVRVVLDADPRVNDASGFEWRVSAAASIVEHFATRGFDVDLASAGMSRTLEAGQGVEGAMISLALLETSSDGLVVPAGDQTTFVLTGRLDQHAADRLIAQVPGPDTIAFAAAGSSEAALQTLTAAHWRVVLHDPREEVPAAWSRVTSPSTV